MGVLVDFGSPLTYGSRSLGLRSPECVYASTMSHVIQCGYVTSLKLTIVLGGNDVRVKAILRPVSELQHDFSFCLSPSLRNLQYTRHVGCVPRNAARPLSPGLSWVLKVLRFRFSDFSCSSRLFLPVRSELCHICGQCLGSDSRDLRSSSRSRGVYSASGGRRRMASNFAFIVLYSLFEGGRTGADLSRITIRMRIVTWHNYNHDMHQTCSSTQRSSEESTAKQASAAPGPPDVHLHRRPFNVPSWHPILLRLSH